MDETQQLLNDLDKRVKYLETQRINQQQIVPGAIQSRLLAGSPVLANGTLLYADANNNFVALPIGSSGQELQVSSGIPAWTDQPASTALVSKAGTTTHDISATGTQAITGVGFKPTGIVLEMAIAGTKISCHSLIDSALTNGIYFSSPDFAASPTSGFFYGGSGSENGALIVDSSNYATFTISALGADGFTFTWSKAGTPTGTVRISYLCIK